MDIKIPSDLPATKPVVSQVSDLLTQLKAAGTIEAEVIKLLQGNKLLLSSRLGDILTSNSLNYKPGDRLDLRLDDSARQPVLKTSPRPAKTIILDSRQNPELTRALAPDRPTLARVIKIVAQQAEIQLAEQILKLPRQVTLARNQLLSLQRNDTRHSIEISRIDSKAIYKAVLKQLVPQQAENSRSSLVRLLNLISHSTVKPHQVPAQRSETTRQQQPNSPIPPAPAAGNKTGVSANQAHVLGRMQARPGNDGSQRAATTASTAPGKSGNSISPERSGPAVRLLSAIDSKNRLPGAPQVASVANKTMPLTARGAETLNRGKTGKSHSTRFSATQVPVKPAQTSVNPIQPGGVGAHSRATAVDKTTSQTATTRTITGTTSDRAAAAPVAGLHITSGQTIQPGPAQAANLSGQPPGASSTVSPAFQPLLQLVTRFPEIDAAQIKKWFEFARLIQPSKATVSSAAPADIFRLLNQFSEGGSFSRELSQALQQNSRAADGDSPVARAQAQEALLQQARDGLKLVEQSLSQNLQQRATLGLQQETQQPLSLSLALPFVEDQETKPLYIDLAERNQAQEEDDKSWDIRLSFELAGLGAISCHLVLEGRAIAASFYSEQAQTRERIETELPQLRRQLSRAGFAPGEFHSFPGKPAPNRAPAAADFSEALVDIEV